MRFSSEGTLDTLFPLEYWVISWRTDAKGTDLIDRVASSSPSAPLRQWAEMLGGDRGCARSVLLYVSTQPTEPTTQLGPVTKRGQRPP